MKTREERRTTNSKEHLGSQSKSKRKNKGLIKQLDADKLIQKIKDWVVSNCLPFTISKVLTR
jgi:hypothetical protein